MEEKYLIFTVQEKRYALPSKLISEVAGLEKVFPLPLVPDYVLGMINRYSVPYALVDVNFLLQKDASNAPPQAELPYRKVIVLKENVDRLALLIDDVTDIADLPTEQLMQIEQDEAEKSGPINAFFEWNGSHVLCLETGGLISRIKQDFVQ